MIKMIPIIGPVRETSGSIIKTSNKYKFPLTGVLLMAFKLTDTQQVDLSATFIDKKGNPAPVDGLPEWFTDNPNVLSLVPSPDGLACKISAVGPIGTAIVSMKADADLGSGIIPISGLFDVEVVSGAAVQVTITPGTPSEQP